MKVELATNQEYRIEVMENQKLRIMVIAGIAEVRGQELLNDKWHVFTKIRTSIFTFTGAKLKIDGTCELQYKAISSPMPKIFSYFDYLYKTPNLNKTILVLGHGRSTFCSTLANYFVRMHKSVLFTEIDPAKGNIFPGALSSMVVSSLVDYKTGFNMSSPTCFFFGSTEIENMELYELQIDALIDSVEKRNFVGLHMILAPELSVDMLNILIKKFKICETVIIGDERLFNKLNLLSNKLQIENSGYIHENTVAASINRYFNGFENEYKPCAFLVKQPWQVVRIGEEFIAPESALPLGATRKVGKTGVNKTEPVCNAVLAISEAATEAEVPTSKVIGFAVCLDEKKFRILCTQPKLPKNAFLIQGSIRYIDF